MKYKDGSQSDSALYVAVENGDIQMIKYLLNYGADKSTAKDALEFSQSAKVKKLLAYQ